MTVTTGGRGSPLRPPRPPASLDLDELFDVDRGVLERVAELVGDRARRFEVEHVVDALHGAEAHQRAEHLADLDAHRSRELAGDVALVDAHDALARLGTVSSVFRSFWPGATPSSCAALTPGCARSNASNRSSLRTTLRFFLRPALLVGSLQAVGGPRPAAGLQRRAGLAGCGLRVRSMRPSTRGAGCAWPRLLALRLGCGVAQRLSSRLASASLYVVGGALRSSARDSVASTPLLRRCSTGAAAARAPR